MRSFVALLLRMTQEVELRMTQEVELRMTPDVLNSGIVLIN
jgi:hypothetical protein